MSVFDIVDTSRIVYTLIFGILPVILLGVSILKPRGLYYMTIGGVFYLFATLFRAEFKLMFIYAGVYFVFAVFWKIKGGIEYQRDAYSFGLYKMLFESYYADDLNDDGINDAFDNWKIAHDPRFTWIFASRKVRRERKLRQEYGKFGAYMGYNPYFGDRINDAIRNGYDDPRKRAGRADDVDPRRRAEAQAHRRAEAEARERRRQREEYYYATGDRNMGKREQKDEAQRRVEAQHEFARRHNLRYFAMCASKDEGKKLYHKYAAKYHPDNAVTGDKEKFIVIDEEYNRFSQIDEMDFVI